MKRIFKLLSVVCFVFCVVFGVAGCTTAPSYELSFETNGGSSVETQTHVVGSKITNLPTPTKEYFEFDHWFQDEELTQIVTTPYTMPGEDTILYARYIVDESAITNIITMAIGDTGKEKTFTVNNTGKFYILVKDNNNVKNIEKITLQASNNLEYSSVEILDKHGNLVLDNNNSDEVWEPSVEPTESSNTYVLILDVTAAGKVKVTLE